MIDSKHFKIVLKRPDCLGKTLSLISVGRGTLKYFFLPLFLERRQWVFDTKLLEMSESQAAETKTR